MTWRSLPSPTAKAWGWEPNARGAAWESEPRARERAVFLPNEGRRKEAPSWGTRPPESRLLVPESQSLAHSLAGSTVFFA
jgi:hypothetical protein